MIKRILTSNDMERQAVEWFQLLHSEGTVTEEQLINYINWLKASPKHEELIARCERVWKLLGELEKDPEFSQLEKELFVKEFETVSIFRRKRVYLPVAGIAAALLAYVFIPFFYNQTRVTHSETASSYRTVTGELQDVFLDDGSTIALNTATVLHVDYTDNLREVFLTRGEALFNVVYDGKRRFVVYAGNGEVKALGTTFNVRIKDSDVIVSLIEGKLEVKTETHFFTGRTEYVRNLSSGQQTIYDDDGQIQEVNDVDTSLIVQWHSRKLSFTDMPLHEIVSEINRYTTVKLVIADPEISDKKLSAYFDIDNVDSFLIATKKFFGINSVLHEGKILLIKEDQ